VSRPVVTLLEVPGAPVNFVLHRPLVGDMPIRVGDVLPARIFSREGQGGVLILSGVRVPAAQLPPEPPVGMRLRLRVQEAGQERLVLRVVDGPATAEATPPAAAADPLAGALRAGLAVPLPGGQVVRLFVDPGEGHGGTFGRGGAASRVTLRFEAAALGRVDLGLELRPGAVAGTVHASAGAPAERLSARAEELRGALARATGRPASVSIRPREETVDLRA